MQVTIIIKTPVCSVYGSTFAANFKYLSYNYNISQDESRFTYLSHLIKNVDIKFHRDFQNQSTVNTIVELCAIRDDVTEYWCSFSCKCV